MFGGSWWTAYFSDWEDGLNFGIHYLECAIFQGTEDRQYKAVNAAAHISTYDLHTVV